MSLLLLKLIATPALVGLAGWSSRRWGPAVGGWFAGVPITSGPISLFLALEYGPAFATDAALGTLYAMPAIAAYGIAYARLARRGGSWLACLLVSQGAYGATFLVLHLVTPSPLLVFALAVAGIGAGIASVGLRDRPMLVSLSSNMVLGLRVGVATAMVLLITAVAPWLGPALSGFVATILVVAAVLAAAGHREHGAPGGMAVIRGLMLGQISFLGFYTVVWSQLGDLGVAATYLLALAAAGAIGLAVVHSLRRPAMR